ncbi:MAG: arylsulfatase [Thermomicrobiales bacterium]
MPELTEYTPGTPFPGVIDRTYETSTPAWPRPVRAEPGAPNVVFIVLDDTGFGHLGCYGSPIRTPNLDALASDGVRYSNMHTTALCSPSRACILTGRNHHSNGMACVTEGTAGYPGYNGEIPFENGFLPEILQRNGYSTYAIGKWHLTPNDQISAAGPYDRWPLGRGFDRYYGFLGGETHQYYPELVYDNHRVEPPRTPDEGYHVTEDLVDHAIQFIADAKQIAPEKPFFLYFCPGAMHAPHHVRPEWTERYAGAFDDGWDVYRERVLERQKQLGIVPANTELSRHDPDVTPWDACSPDERRLYARMMEVFAGFLEHTDHHIGRLLDFLDECGERDNTLIMCVSDNGASAEGGPGGSVNENLFFNNVSESFEANLAQIDTLGGPSSFNHFAWGWAWAGNTPFRRWKRETYRGGVSDPFIVHWPAGIKARGEVRHQYGHLIDMVPHSARCAGNRGANDHSRGAAVANSGSQPRRYLRRRARSVEAHGAVLRDAGTSFDLSRRMARGLPVARPVIPRGGAAVRRAHRRRHAAGARYHGVGALSRRCRLGREPRSRGVRTRHAGGAHRPLV